MSKIVIGPAIFGLVIFVMILFIAPLIVAEADLVAGVARSILEYSNRHYATTPPIVASYIANLDLAIVAVTAGILMTVVAQLLVAIQAILVGLFRGVKLLLRWERKKKPPSDLPPIELDPRYRDSKPEENVLGRGLDSIDRDP